MISVYLNCLSLADDRRPHAQSALVVSNPHDPAIYVVSRM